MIAFMQPAGVPVSAELISELAQIVDEPTASMLERGLEVGTKVLALTIDDRERLLRALDDPPAGFAELRGVLLREHEWRKREGLV